jgi:hypothetical protein
MNRIHLPELKGLSGVQRKAILLLVEGQNTSDVAGQCGIDRKTLYNWCHHNARFQFCLEATREALEQQWAAQLAEATRASLQLLRALIADENVPARLRLRAALEILKRDEKKGAWLKAAVPPAPSTRSRLEPQDLDAEIPQISPDSEFSTPDPPQTPRNAFCPCGSGDKYKRCCGKGEPTFRDN